MTPSTHAIGREVADKLPAIVAFAYMLEVNPVDHRGRETKERIVLNLLRLRKLIEARSG